MPSWPMRVFKGLVLLVFCAVVIMPFVGVISTSMAPNKQINESGGLVLLPEVDRTSRRTRRCSPAAW